MTGPFDNWTDADLAELVAAHPLAWIISPGNPGCSTQMPLLLECDADGKAQSLLGHLPRAHPITTTLRTEPHALFLFRGPHAYISPERMSDATWAPTWNFAAAQIEADVAFDDALTDEALRRIVDHMEKDRPSPWTIEAMGARYEELKRRVIGFRATVTATSARFKLGQDERPEIFDQILAGLGESPLAILMRQHKRDR